MSATLGRAVDPRGQVSERLAACIEPEPIGRTRGIAQETCKLPLSTPTGIVVESKRHGLES